MLSVCSTFKKILQKKSGFPKKKKLKKIYKKNKNKNKNGAFHGVNQEYH